MALVKEITCVDAVALVSDYLEGALSRRDRRRLEAHLAQCDGCSAYLEQMKTTIALTGTVTVDDLSPEALDAIVELFDRYRGESPS